MTQSSQRGNLLICLCLTTAIAAVYWPVLHAGFVNYDDPKYVTESPRVLGGLTWQNLAWALTTREMGHWHPLTWASLMLDHQLFGMWAGGYHLVNVLLHAANALLLFAVLYRATAELWRSVCVAALFALHPLHVESVAWIAERKDVLNTFLLMLTLWAYVRYVEQPSSRRYWPCVGLYALALMSKSMGVTLPFVLLLMDFWPLGRTRWAKPATGRDVKVPSLTQLVKEKLPFLAFAVPASVAAYWAEGSTLLPLENFPLGIRIANVLLSYAAYIGKTIWPTGLAIFYPLRSDLSIAATTVAGIGLVGITAAAFWMARRKPWFATGWFWYVGTLVPVIGLVQIGTYSMADRYTYMPLIGLFVMLCWAVPPKVMEQRNLKISASVAAGLVLAACGALSRIQVGYWKNSETLFRHALNVTRDNWLAHNNLGVALKEAGRTQEEVAEYRQALRIKPDCAEAHYNLGSALWQAGSHQEAISHWEQAVRSRPEYADAHNNLGDAFLRLGKAPEAIGHYEQAWRIKPAQAEAYNDLGAALWRAGRVHEAVRYYEQALQIKPDYPEAHYNLGGALEQQGRVQEAIAQYEQALQGKTDFVEAKNRLERLRAGRE